MTARIGCAICLLVGSALAQPANEPGKGVNFYSLEKEIALGNALAGRPFTIRFTDERKFKQAENSP